MSGRNKRGRNAIALSLSTAGHLILIGILINQAPPPPYDLPHPFEPPMDVQIVPPPPTPIPRIVVPPIPTPKAETPPPQITPPLVKPPPTPPKPQPAAQAAPAAPVPPKPTPPTPPVQPAKPTPPAPSPPKPSLLPAPVAPARAPAPPAPSVNPTPSPTPAARPSPAPVVAAPAPPRIAAPAITARPSLLNLHKAAKEAPANVPTLPMAPSGRPSGGGGGGAPAAGEAGGSRLNGLSPYPYGAMPSGGPGLRGTLVGCANADAVSLSSVERARCNSRFGAAASRAPTLDGIDPAKRAQFNKTAERQDAERRAEGAMPVGTTAGASGFGGLGPNP